MQSPKWTIFLLALLSEHSHHIPLHHPFTLKPAVMRESQSPYMDQNAQMSWPLHFQPPSPFMLSDCSHCSSLTGLPAVPQTHPARCSLRTFAWLFSAWKLLPRYPASWQSLYLQIISQISPSSQGPPERCYLIRKWAQLPDPPHPIPGTHNPLLCFIFLKNLSPSIPYDVLIYEAISTRAEVFALFTDVSQAPGTSSVAP